MAKPLFQPILTTKKVFVSSRAKCGACRLYETCDSPKMAVSGRGRRGILVVAEAPGKDEDAEGTQFVGVAGQLLRESFRRYDIDLDRDCWKTNALICRPPENATPTNIQIDHCRPNLYNTIAELNPRVIVPLGGPAVRSLLAPLWREDVGSISNWVGWKIPLQKWNCWVCPSFHPSFVRRKEDDRNGPVVKLWFNRHLEAIAGLDDRPWKDVPDYKSQIKIVTDTDRAADWIERKISDPRHMFAWDYETDRLKPDHPEARIVSCAICCDAKETIAYPFSGRAVQATKKFIQSTHPKIGANNKFETRWSLAKLGAVPINWVWDCNTSAHHLDNRGEISSVKFQAFIRLGFEPWDSAVAPYLKSDNSEEGANSKNRIDEVPLRTLLEYNGLDALVEFLLAIKQKKEMIYDQPV